MSTSSKESQHPASMAPAELLSSLNSDKKSEVVRQQEEKIKQLTKRFNELGLATAAKKSDLDRLYELLIEFDSTTDKDKLLQHVREYTEKFSVLEKKINDAIKAGEDLKKKWIMELQNKQAELVDRIETAPSDTLKELEQELAAYQTVIDKATLNKQEFRKYFKKHDELLKQADVVLGEKLAVPDTGESDAGVLQAYLNEWAQKEAKNRGGKKGVKTFISETDKQEHKNLVLGVIREKLTDGLGLGESTILIPMKTKKKTTDIELAGRLAAVRMVAKEMGIKAKSIELVDKGSGGKFVRVALEQQASKPAETPRVEEEAGVGEPVSTSGEAANKPRTIVGDVGEKPKVEEEGGAKLGEAIANKQKEVREEIDALLDQLGPIASDSTNKNYVRATPLMKRLRNLLDELKHPMLVNKAAGKLKEIRKEVKRLIGGEPAEQTEDSEILNIPDIARLDLSSGILTFENPENNQALQPVNLIEGLGATEGVVIEHVRPGKHEPKAFIFKVKATVKHKDQPVDVAFTVRIVKDSGTAQGGGLQILKPDNTQLISERGIGPARMREILADVFTTQINGMLRAVEAEGPVATKSKSEGAKKEEEKKEIKINSMAFSEKKDGHVTNQDSYLNDPAHGLYGVFDGVGGHKGGDLASQMARDGILNRAALLEEPGLTPEQVKDRINTIFAEIAKEIEKKGEELASQEAISADKEDARNIATTASLVKLWKGSSGEMKAVFGHAGDSRIYIFRAVEKKLELVTIDDNAVKEDLEATVQAGKMEESELSEQLDTWNRLFDKVRSAAELENLLEDEEQRKYALLAFRERNVIFNSLGKNFKPAQTGVIDIKLGDKIIITSDGVHDNLTRDEIEATVLANLSPADIGKKLVDHARKVAEEGAYRSKPDDTTAVVVDWGEGETAIQPASDQKRMEKGVLPKLIIDLDEAKQFLTFLEAAGVFRAEQLRFERDNAEKVWGANYWKAIIGNETDKEKIKTIVTGTKPGSEQDIIAQQIAREARKKFLESTKVGKKEEKKAEMQELKEAEQILTLVGKANKQDLLVGQSDAQKIYRAAYWKHFIGNETDEQKIVDLVTKPARKDEDTRARKLAREAMQAYIAASRKEVEPGIVPPTAEAAPAPSTTPEPVPTPATTHPTEASPAAPRAAGAPSPEQPPVSPAPAEHRAEHAPAEHAPAEPARRDEVPPLGEQPVTNEEHRRRRIIDVPERRLLEMIKPHKLQEVLNQIILGNLDLAENEMQYIFSRSDIDENELTDLVERFGYNSAEFKQLWSAELYKGPYRMLMEQVEQLRRNWIAENTSWWEKAKVHLPDRAKMLALQYAPALAVAGIGIGAGAIVAATGGSAVAVGAVAATPFGLWRGIRGQVDRVKNFFGRKSQEAQTNITRKEAELEDAKRTSQAMIDSLLGAVQNSGLQHQIASLVSQGLRDASAANLQVENANRQLALEQITDEANREQMRRGNHADARIDRESQAARAEALLRKLYSTQEMEDLFDQALRNDPTLLTILKGVDAFKNDFGIQALIRRYEESGGTDKTAKKALIIAASGLAAGTLGAGLAADVALRPLLGALAGGYIGVRYGHKKDIEERQRLFNAEIRTEVTEAEQVVQQYERNGVPELTMENLSDIRGRLQRLRTPLSLGVLDRDVLRYRAQNALRRLEAIYLAAYLFNPHIPIERVNTVTEQTEDGDVTITEQRSEVQTHSGVENLLMVLNDDVEQLSQRKKLVQAELTKKPRIARALAYGVVGALAGLGLGTAASEWGLQRRLEHQNSAVRHWLENHHKPVATGNLAPPHGEIPQQFNADIFIREHGLGAGAAGFVRQLTHDYPALNNSASIERILQATKVGDHVHASVHGDVIKSSIDTLDESGGERRLAIFEELIKHDRHQAALFLQGEHLGQHQLTHLHMKGKFDAEEFVKHYDPSNPKTARGLYEAFRAKESTELANSGLERDATTAHAGRDIHAGAKEMNYFGLNKGKPVISGGGTVRVVEVAHAPAVHEQMATGEAGAQQAAAIDLSPRDAALYAGVPVEHTTSLNTPTAVIPEAHAGSTTAVETAAPTPKGTESAVAGGHAAEAAIAGKTQLNRAATATTARGGGSAVKGGATEQAAKAAGGSEATTPAKFEIGGKSYAIPADASPSWKKEFTKLYVEKIGTNNHLTDGQRKQFEQELGALVERKAPLKDLQSLEKKIDALNVAKVAGESALGEAVKSGHIERTFRDDGVQMDMDYKVTLDAKGQVKISFSDEPIKSGFDPARYLGEKAAAALDKLGISADDKLVANEYVRQMYLEGRILQDVKRGSLEYRALAVDMENKIADFSKRFGVSPDNLPGPKK